MSIKYKLSAVLAVGVLAVPVVSFAQSMTTVQLQAEIASLTAQVQVLQQQLVVQGGGGSPVTWCHTFNANLSAGQSAGEVTALQTALENDGETVIATGVFDAQTVAAVAAFQDKYASSVLAPVGLSVGTGYVGSATRVKLNSLYGCGTATQSPVTQLSPMLSSSSVPTVAVSLDPSSPSNGQIVMGSIGNPLAVYRFTQTSNSESVKITALKVTDYTTAGNGEPFSNLTFYNGATLLGTAGTAQVASSGYTYQFYFANPVIIPEGTSLALTLKGDAAPWASGVVKDNTVHQFEIINQSDVTAFGVTSNLPASVTISNANGYGFAVLRSTMSMSTMALGQSNNRIKSPTDVFGALSFSANAAGPVSLSRVKITLSGSALAQNPTAFLNSVRLLDANNNSVTNDGAAVSVSSTGYGSEAITWTFPSGWVISGGATYSFTVVGNSTFIPSVAGNTVQSLAIDIQNSADITYADALDSRATTGLTLPSIIFPISINSVFYAGSGGGVATSTVAVSLDPASPSSGQIVMGSTGNTLMVFDLSGAGNPEAVKITQLPVRDFVVPNPSMPPLTNLTLWNGSTLLGSVNTGVQNPINGPTGEYYPYPFQFTNNPIIVSQGNSIALTLKGDVTPFSAGATDGIKNSFKVVKEGIIASGQNSGQVATTTGSAIANPQTVLRSILTFAATPLGATSGRGKLATDQFAELSFSANSAGSLAVNTVAVTLTGSAYSATLLNDPNGVRLLDENDLPLGTSTASPVFGGATFTFNLGATTNGQAVSAGTTRNWTLVINDSDLAVATGQSAVNLSATINMNSDLTYTDGLTTPATSGLTLSSQMFPILLNSVMFAQGI